MATMRPAPDLHRTGSDYLDHLIARGTPPSAGHALASHARTRRPADSRFRRSPADPVLRSLDAIHLATALQLGAPSLVFLSYDKRLSAAASQEGLTVAAPT
jgi:hypothetical protein